MDFQVFDSNSAEIAVDAIKNGIRIFICCIPVLGILVGLNSYHKISKDRREKEEKKNNEIMANRMQSVSNEVEGQVPTEEQRKRQLEEIQIQQFIRNQQLKDSLESEPFDKSKYSSLNLEFGKDGKVKR